MNKTGRTVTVDNEFFERQVNNVAGISFDKKLFNKGVNFNKLTSEELTLNSTGLIPVSNVRLELQNTDGVKH